MITEKDRKDAEEYVDNMDAVRRHNEIMERVRSCSSLPVVNMPVTREEQLEHLMRSALERIDLYDIEGARRLLMKGLR